MRHLRILAYLITSIFVASCSVGRFLVVSSARPFFEDAMTSLMQESDPEIARLAMASDLKLLEGMLVSTPNSPHLLSMAARGFAGYAMLFYDPVEGEKAKELYRRSLNYGLRVLAERDPVFGQRESRFKDFENAIGSVHNEDIEVVYWAAVAWAGWINLSRTDPMALAEFPRVRLLMDWVSQRDETYFFCGPNWFYGVYYSTLPPIVGGDAKKSKEYFEKAIDATDGKFLWGKLYYAQTYAVQTLDRVLFEQILNEIIQAAANELPDANLLNEVARVRAKSLLGKAGELF